jgi:hypothetical protein
LNVTVELEIVELPFTASTTRSLTFRRSNAGTAGASGTRDARADTPTMRMWEASEVPTELVFSSGATLKVVADLQDVADALESGRTLLDSSRFAGFRGDDVVSAERVVVNLAAVAHAGSITAP